MSELSRLSDSLNVSQRTLRRAADSGLFRANRLSERRLRIPHVERRYLKRSWPLLAELRKALRTEPNVRMAVLFGSAARGEDGPLSDVDVLVSVRDPSRFRMMELEERLNRSVGRPVDLLRMSDAESDRTLLGEILADGRVLIDREAAWPALAAQRDAIRSGAEQDLAALARGALDRAFRAASR